MDDRRVAFVTGASRNTGQAIALRFLRSGMDVAATALTDSEGLEAVRAEGERLGRRTWTGLGDLGERRCAQELVGDATEALGPIQVLVHTVALRPSIEFLELTDDQWHRVLAVNLDSAFHLTQATAPGMLDAGWGRIIFFSGVGVFTSGRRHSHVMATKSGIIGLARGLAVDFADRGVTVNTIVPGIIETEHTLRLMREAAEAPGGPIRGLTLPPLGRPAGQDEIAAACAYLASDDGAYVTGQCLHLNGGMYFGS